jgi:hypothetical protein
MKKSIVIPLSIAIVVLAVGGWYVFSNSGASQAAEIAQIASSTEAQIKNYTTTTRKYLHYDLKQWQTNDTSNDTEVISIFGLSFESPWGEPQLIDNRESIASLSFSGGRYINIFNKVDPNESPQRYLEDIENAIPKESASPTKLFSQILGSNYTSHDFWKYVLDTKLDDIKTATTVKSARARSYAIPLRSTSVLSRGQPYSFSTKSAKGFVVKRSDYAEIQGSTNDGNKRFGFVLADTSDSGQVSKEAINTIISSMKFSESYQPQTANSRSDNY